MQKVEGDRFITHPNEFDGMDYADGEQSFNVELMQKILREGGDVKWAKQL